MPPIALFALVLAVVAAVLFVWLYLSRSAQHQTQDETRPSASPTPMAAESQPSQSPAPAATSETKAAPFTVLSAQPATTLKVINEPLSFMDISMETRGIFKSWVADFPAMSPSAMRIWEEVRSVDTNAKRVARITSQDPIMSARLLRMANSASAAQDQEVTSTEQAILLMGYDCVLAMAIHQTMSGLKPFPPGGFDQEALTRHGVVTGLLAGALARHSGRVHSGEAVTVGVMHDIGKLVMNASNATLVKQLLDTVNTVLGESLLRKEERLFGANHAVVGAMLATEWKLPSTLAIVLRFHHDPTAAALDEHGQRAHDLAATVFVANQLAKLAGWAGNDKEIDLPPGDMLSALKLPDTYEAIAKEVLPEVLTRLKMFGYQQKPAAEVPAKA